MKQSVKKIQPVKVVAPIFDEQTESTRALEELACEEKVSDLRFPRTVVTKLKHPYLSINNCTFSHVVFRECELKWGQLTDVRFENCDLSNISFAGTTFYRVEFISCKLLGTNLSETTLNHVRMEGCSSRYINLAMSKMRTVRFTNCDFRTGSFNDSKLLAAAFDNCELTEADFSHTPLKGIDLRTNRIAGIQLNIADLRGAIVNPMQAMELLPMLGVVIE